MIERFVGLIRWRIGRRKHKGRGDATPMWRFFFFLAFWKTVSFMLTPNMYIFNSLQTKCKIRSLGLLQWRLFGSFLIRLVHLLKEKKSRWLCGSVIKQLRNSNKIICYCHVINVSHFGPFETIKNICWRRPWDRPRSGLNIDEDNEV